jgi:hypothetical protein
MSEAYSRAAPGQLQVRRRVTALSALTQQRPRINAQHAHACFPYELCPLVFIYRSPTVKTDFCLQQMMFSERAPAVKWYRRGSITAVVLVPYPKEFSWM